MAARRQRARWLGFVVVAIALAYPLLLWFGLERVAPRTLALAALATAVVTTWWRAGAGTWADRAAPLTVGAVIALAATATWWTNDPTVLLFVPVAVALTLGTVFGATLWRPPTMIARFARAQGAELDGPRLAHCRQATWAWVLFFAGHAVLSGTLAAAQAIDAWAWWTGVLSYVAMGVLFAGEFLVRRLRFREFTDAPHDRLLARLLREGSP